MPVLILSFKSLFTEISIGESFLQNIGDAIREKSNNNSQYIFIKRPPVSNQNRSLHILRSAFFSFLFLSKILAPVSNMFMYKGRSGNLIKAINTYFLTMSACFLGKKLFVEI